MTHIVCSAGDLPTALCRSSEKSVEKNFLKKIFGRFAERLYLCIRKEGKEMPV